MYVDLLSVGPPAGRPVQYRLSGPDIQKVRELAQKLAAVVGEHPLVSDIGFNWNEPARVVKVDVLQDKARQLGVTSQDIAGALNGIVGGTSITQVRDAIYLVDVVDRARAAERQSIETLQNLQLPGKNGQSVPLRGSRDLPLRARAAGDLAPRPVADDHGQAAASSTRPSRRRWSSSSNPRCRSSSERSRPAMGWRSAAPSRRAPSPRDRSPRWSR